MRDSTIVARAFGWNVSARGDARSDAKLTVDEEGRRSCVCVGDVLDHRDRHCHARSWRRCDQRADSRCCWRRRRRSKRDIVIATGVRTRHRALVGAARHHRMHRGHRRAGLVEAAHRRGRQGRDEQNEHGRDHRREALRSGCNGRMHDRSNSCRSIGISRSRPACRRARARVMVVTPTTKRALISQEQTANAKLTVFPGVGGKTVEAELGKLLLYQLSYARLRCGSPAFSERYKRLKHPPKRCRHFITLLSSKGRNGCR